MNKLEQSLEWLIHQMWKVILNLLSSLYINEMKKESTKPIDILFKLLIFLLKPFDSEIHITTNSTTFFVFLHMFVHFKESILLGTKANIQQNCILSFYLFTKTIEKPIMWRKFSTILVFGDKE